jgi:predicted transposase YbfD/YdcC
MVGEKRSVERRYFISSPDGKDAGRFAGAVRGHWGVENGLHWSLAGSFGEDQCRVGKGNAAEKMSRLRRIALNLLKREQTAKLGIKAKRLKAGWDEQYLLKVLGIWMR